MINGKHIDAFPSSPSFDEEEKLNVSQKVNEELNNALCGMVRLSFFINAFIGFVVAWVLRKEVQTSVLLTWYGILILLQVINVAWSFYYEKNKTNLSKVRVWRIGYLIILAALSLTWGSIAVLFTTPDIHYQVYIFTCLQVALIAFNVGAMIDFPSTVINTVCLLLPYITLHLHQAHSRLGNSNPQLDLAFSVTLTVLGIFLLATTFVGAKVIRKFFVLIFENVALSKKLEMMNKFLENRVKERTVELEDSLKLVTHQATHDLLTTLPNQRLLLEYLDEAILGSNQNSYEFGIIFFSLNELDKINDGCGYKIGDTVIRMVAERLRNMFAEKLSEVNYKITISRKDIFIIIIDKIYEISDLETKANELFTVLDNSITAEKQVFKLTASIGVSVYPHDGKEINLLLMNADTAMLHARKRGGNSLMLYQNEINTDVSREIEVETHLHSALERNEFTLCYQPIINLKTGKIHGAEALLRWNCAALGPIPPTDFIYLAEANGIIFPLGQWAARTACRQNKIWHDMGFNFMHVAINVSAKQLQSRSIIQKFEEILKETEINPASMEIELTETIAFHEDVTHKLKQLKALGFELSMDDYGTGYSGLSSLKLFNIDILKIDKIFIDDVGANDDNSKIVLNTIALAHEMKISVVAEGVETKAQMEFLKSNDCDMAQGYYFGPALDADAFTELLASGKLFNT